MLDAKPLGRSGKQISAIGLGCVTFGREIDENQSYGILDYALEKGITFLDTAEAYGGGQAREGRKLSYGIKDVRETTGEMSSSERIIGRWMRARNNRDEVTICTKVTIGGGSPENIKRALRGSLERLQTDHIDVHKMHSWADDVPIGETLGGLSVGVTAGQVGIIGCSNYSAKQIQASIDASEAGGLPRMEITQPPYNVARPPTWHGHTSREELEDEILPLCGRERIAVTPYSPLGAGFLTGKYVNDKSRLPDRTRFHVSPGHADVYFTERNFLIVENLRAKSKELGIPMAKLAMAFAMTHPNVTAVLIGARETRHIDNAIEAYTMGLDPTLRQEMSDWGLDDD
jgi:aryl-alcohol dehydrogenase-like predicted oxidoreductase